MSMFTKGPWHQDKYGSVRGADGETIAFRGVSTLCAGSDERIAEAEANTTLACAAPDLLEALENMLAAFDNPILRRKLQSSFNDEAISSARDAIAKARGEK